MARKWHEDSNIDPFNASDPIMPGDDSAAWHEDDCALGDDSYEAPTKKNTRLTERFKRQDSPVDNVDTDEEDELSNSDERQSNKGGLDSEWGERLFGASTENSHVRIVDADEINDAGTTKAKPGKVLRIVVITIVVISLVSSAIGLAASLIGNAFRSSVSPAERSYSELVEELQDRGYHVDEWTSTDEDSDDAAAEAYLTLVIDDRLSTLKNNDNFRQMLIEDFDYKFEGTYGFKPADAGLDSSTYADKVLNNYTYEISSVYAFMDDGEGYVYSTIKAYQYWNFGYVFDNLAHTYLNDNNLMLSGVSSFTAEQKAQIKSYFDEAMNADWELGDDYAAFDFTLEGDTWSIDEDAYQEEIKYAFYIYYGSSDYEEVPIGSADLDTENKSA